MRETKTQDYSHEACHVHDEAQTRVQPGECAWVCVEIREGQEKIVFGQLAATPPSPRPISHRKSKIEAFWKITRASQTISMSSAGVLGALGSKKKYFVRSVGQSLGRSSPTCGRIEAFWEIVRCTTSGGGSGAHRPLREKYFV